MFGLDTKSKIDPNEFFDEQIIQSLLKRFPLGGTDLSKIVHNTLGLMKDKEEVELAKILDFVLPYMKEEDFVLKKNYTVKRAVSTIYGKWP